MEIDFAKSLYKTLKDYKKKGYGNFEFCERDNFDNNGFTGTLLTITMSNDEGLRKSTPQFIIDGQDETLDSLRASYEWALEKIKS